jgi:hypothetical protein
MHRVAVVGVVVIAVVGVAACSTPRSQETTGSRPGATPVAAGASTSPSELVTTVQQYAGLVNSSMKEIRETWQKYEAELCGVRATSLVCKVTPMTLDLQVQTLLLNLAAAAKPGIPAYIGKPPAEIEKLVADTVAADQTVDLAIDSTGEPSSGMQRAVINLMGVLDRWDPYV